MASSVSSAGSESASAYRFFRQSSARFIVQIVTAVGRIFSGDSTVHRTFVTVSRPASVSKSSHSAPPSRNLSNGASSTTCSFFASVTVRTTTVLGSPSMSEARTASCPVPVTSASTETDFAVVQRCQ